MNGDVALDTSVAVRFLNGDEAVVVQVLALTFQNQMLRLKRLKF
jgi:hypothetical protein